jgi:hypothetical protein
VACALHRSPFNINRVPIHGPQSNATISNVAACQIREQLLRQYSEAAENLVPLSKELTNVALSYEADMFTHIWKHFTRAQETCEHARRALETHTASHGCV